MTDILNLILQGATIGRLYAMFAAGLSIVFGVLRQVNLAHGDMIILGAYTGHAVAVGAGLGFSSPPSQLRPWSWWLSATRCSASC